MNIDQIDKAIEEAERFTLAAFRAKKTIKAIEKEHSKFYSVVSKDVASCRRASLDLTRSLAEMRK